MNRTSGEPEFVAQKFFGIPVSVVEMCKNPTDKLSRAGKRQISVFIRRPLLATPPPPPPPPPTPPGENWLKAVMFKSRPRAPSNEIFVCVGISKIL